MNVLILYYSKTGHTLEAISSMVDGIISKGSTAKIVSTKDFDNSILKDYDIIIVASPCWGGIVGFNGVASPIVKVLKNLPENGLNKKVCGGIAVHAASGGKATLKHLSKLVKNRGCKKFISGPIIKAGSLASLTIGKPVSEEGKQKCRNFGISLLV